ncbi:hypothetical protein [Acinetobacter sp.]|uniref:hypothetical protein n=1 Tax=Acinetobacter sp. TaxID=472 RepID=UPI00333E287F
MNIKVLCQLTLTLWTTPPSIFLHPLRVHQLLLTPFIFSEALCKYVLVGIGVLNDDLFGNPFILSIVDAHQDILSVTITKLLSQNIEILLA